FGPRQKRVASGYGQGVASLRQGFDGLRLLGPGSVLLAAVDTGGRLLHDLDGANQGGIDLRLVGEGHLADVVGALGQVLVGRHQLVAEAVLGVGADLSLFGDDLVEPLNGGVAVLVAEDNGVFVDVDDDAAAFAGFLGGASPGDNLVGVDAAGVLGRLLVVD